MQRMLRLPAVLGFRGKRKTAHYEDVARGLFTKPVPIGARAVAWPDDEVAAITAARIAGKTEDEIRELVAELHAQRVAASPNASGGAK